jgi:RNA polymerase sigma-70 factor (ECF subfamily)
MEQGPLETAMFLDVPVILAADTPAFPAPQMLADSTLLELVQAGDETAMAQLYDSYSRIVYSVALRVLRDPSAAEDILQEVFLSIWRRPTGFVVARGSLGGWLAIVARNRSIDVLRKRRPMDSVDDVRLQSSANVSHDVEEIVMTERVRFLIGTLPQVQQELLEMAFFKGLTHSEIAAETHTPLGTVKTRIRTALLGLRCTLENGSHVPALLLEHSDVQLLA